GDGELRADVVIACANLAVCEALKNRKAEARDRILPILQGSSRAEILNPSKKQMLRQHITDSLNEMHLPGKVIETNFSDMTVDVGH
ncbi:MAG: flagellar basal body-associated FliL family protein, partial [Bdellovibrionales bacterium]|nr:flagellar basal body-associated FliL family protein [Oligoflexia bacterium]